MPGQFSSFGASLKGLIPFVPASSSYNGPKFSGQFYGAVKDVPLGDLPATVSGMAVINVNPNQFASSHLSTPGTSTAALFDAASVKAKLNSNSISIGVNGTGSVGTEFGGVSLSADVAHATAAFVAAGTDPILTLQPNWKDRISSATKIPTWLIPSFALSATRPITDLGGQLSFPWFFKTITIPYSALYYQSTAPRSAAIDDDTGRRNSRRAQID